MRRAAGLIGLSCYSVLALRVHPKRKLGHRGPMTLFGGRGRGDDLFGIAVRAHWGREPERAAPDGKINAGCVPTVTISATAAAAGYRAKNTLSDRVPLRFSGELDPD